jgi:hypothetical protein
MDDYECLSHSKWECKYHVVFIPKYRRKTLYGSWDVQADRRLVGNPFGDPLVVLDVGVDFFALLAHVRATRPPADRFLSQREALPLAAEHERARRIGADGDAFPDRNLPCNFDQAQRARLESLGAVLASYHGAAAAKPVQRVLTSPSLSPTPS